MNKTDLRHAFSGELLELAAKDQRIYAVTSDARNSSTIAAFAEAYPERFVECGIAEQNEVGVAAGIAVAGGAPFVCAPAAFLSARAVEQVKVDLCYSQKHVSLVGVSGGMAYGPSGMTHYSINDVAVMRSFDGMQVFIPCDGYQVRCLTRLMAQSKLPSYMRLGRSAFPDVYSGQETVEIGRACTLRDGKDLTIIACGKMVYPALQAAEALAGEGVQARVIDMFCLKPLDREAIVKAARETGRIVTAEEGVLAGGLGEAVCAVVSQEQPVPVKVLTLPDEHLPCGGEDEINEHCGLSQSGILAAARQLL